MTSFGSLCFGLKPALIGRHASWSVRGLLSTFEMGLLMGCINGGRSRRIGVRQLPLIRSLRPGFFGSADLGVAYRLDR